MGMSSKTSKKLNKLLLLIAAVVLMGATERTAIADPLVFSNLTVFQNNDTTQVNLFSNRYDSARHKPYLQRRYKRHTCTGGGRHFKNHVSRAGRLAHRARFSNSLVWYSKPSANPDLFVRLTGLQPSWCARYTHLGSAEQQPRLCNPRRSQPGADS